MNVKLMRSEISKVYPGNVWKSKVKRMPDTQVIAVYNSFLRNDRFKSPPAVVQQIIQETKQEHRQLTFDDILRGGVLK